jgi:NTE family protein
LIGAIETEIRTAYITAYAFPTIDDLAKFAIDPVASFVGKRARQCQIQPVNELAPGSGERDDRDPSGDPARTIDRKVVNLALQGGGAHGAFAWGVLDRLLEDERVDFDGISATSAGAMNAVTLAYGLTIGGRKGARTALAAFWERIGNIGAFGLLQPSWLDRLLGNDSLRFSPAFIIADLMTRLFSPYEFNPLNINPLRSALSASVDFKVLRSADCQVKLFLSATNVRTGKIKVFDRGEICVDQVMASACLPLLFQAVEIDGEHYWDGGYMGNPAIFPLIYNCASRDIVIIRINPLFRRHLPHSAADILDRVNEISFNSSLMREMRAISFVSKLIDNGAIADGSLNRVLIHTIAADEEMALLGSASKANADREFLERLRDAGRRHADEWLSADFDRVGLESTTDIQADFL